MLDATAIFLHAQQAWIARAVPRYESFRIACEQTFLADKCSNGDDIAFTVRMRDGRSFAEALPAGGGDPKVLLRGAFITGPAGTPLGFYRVLPDGGAPSPSPPNLAPDPLQTIATVTANSHVYDIRVLGEESIGNRRCYHLALHPRFDPDRYPLRELWVEEASFEIVQLLYARPYDERQTWAFVRYRFAPVGAAQIWSIVHIDAQATTHGLVSSRTERVTDDLSDITFPASAPDWYFEPASGG